MLVLANLGATVLGDAHVVGRDAHDLARLVVQHLVGGRVRVSGRGEAYGQAYGQA